MAYGRIALRKNLFINYLVEYFLKNHENPKGTIFSFIILNFVRKGILQFHVIVY